MNVCPGEGVAYDSYYNETDRVTILTLVTIFVLYTLLNDIIV